VLGGCLQNTVQAGTMNGQKYYKALYTVGVEGIFDYNVYNFTQVALTRPDESYFVLPAICQNL
jgi:hypothetical protein